MVNGASELFGEVFGEFVVGVLGVVHEAANDACFFHHGQVAVGRAEIGTHSDGAAKFDNGLFGDAGRLAKTVLLARTIP